jgi:hypothetical protein
MIRLGVLLLALACPAALAQETDTEARALADAFTATDLETLGACQARVEGLELLVDEFAGWLKAEGHTQQLDGLQAGIEGSRHLAEQMSDLRVDVAGLTDISLSASNAAHTGMLAAFKRRAGEDNAAAYARWQPETKLPPACRVAMKRARWKLELDGGAN